MKCLEMRAHGHANRGDDMEMKCLEIRAHGRANRGNAEAMQMTRKHEMGLYQHE